jgi:hypothetical protein
LHMQYQQLALLECFQQEKRRSEKRVATSNLPVPRKSRAPQNTELGSLAGIIALHSEPNM